MEPFSNIIYYIGDAVLGYVVFNIIAFSTFQCMVAHGSITPCIGGKDVTRGIFYSSNMKNYLQ